MRSAGAILTGLSAALLFHRFQLSAQRDYACSRQCA
jgi:hypothetical protein